jgi:enoyl-CoA hydratase/3-hydroxyacyl-CoA dehydrogenase
LHTGKNFVEEWPERCYRGALIVILNQLKALGEKTGKGFYVYDKRCAS